jgi:hypothetical protein
LDALALDERLEAKADPAAVSEPSIRERASKRTVFVEICPVRALPRQRGSGVCI